MEGASDAVIKLLKEFRTSGVIQITCKPVDCAVFINEQQKGRDEWLDPFGAALRSGRN